MQTLIIEQQPPPIVKPTYFLDASSLKESSCQRRLIYTTIYGFTHSTNRHANYKAGYGSAFHRALEYWYGSERLESNKTIAIQMALDYYTPFTNHLPENNPREYRTANHLAQSIKAYFDYYGSQDTLVPIKGMLESKFIIPVYQGDKFNLCLAGTVDLIASYYGEEIFVDHKSTGAYDINEYMQSYELSVQMYFYSWIIEKLIGRRLPCLINGIFLKKPTLKSTVFDGVKFERSRLLKFSDDQMFTFTEWVEKRIKETLQYLASENKNSSPQGTTIPEYSACAGGKFGLCPYYKICSLDIKDQDPMLKSMARMEYNPLHFSD